MQQGSDMSDAGLNPAKTEKTTEGAQASGEPADPLIGVSLANRFQILSKLGAGATGTTYKAYDNLLQRDIAVKIIHQRLIASPEAVERFKKEALTSTSLSHPNICRVYSQGSEQGRLYTVMDCLEGESLAALLSSQGKLDLDLFFLLFHQIIEALQYAHGMNIVHRDIKPGNIIVLETNNQKTAVLVDFGLAKWIDQSGEQGATRTGVLLGSSAYMSPEQCKGERDIDARSDIYSLGCVMLEALIGNSPFQGESDLDVMYKHLNEPLDQAGFLKELPESLADLLQKCLEKDRTKRYQNITELKLDFEKCRNMQDTLKRRWIVKQQKSNEPALPTKVILLLIAGAVLAGIVLVKKSALKNSPTAEDRVGINSKNSLHNPNTEVIPLHRGPLRLLLEKYGDKNRGIQGFNDALIIMKRWEKDRAPHANPEERNAVYTDFSGFYIDRNQYDPAEKYALRVLAAPDSLPQDAASIVARFSLYFRRNGQAENVINYIKKMQEQYPSKFKGYDAESAALGQQALAYMQMKNYSKASEIYQKIEDLAREHNSDQFTDNSWRTSYLMAICLSGKQKSKLKHLEEQCLHVCNNRSDLLAETRWELGHSYTDCGEIDRGIYHLKEAAVIYKKLGNTMRVHECMVLQAQILRVHRRFSEAKAIYDEILSDRCSIDRKLEIYNCLTSDYCFLYDLKDANRYADLALETASELLSRRGVRWYTQQQDVWINIALNQKFGLLRDESKQTGKAFLEKWIEKLKQQSTDSFLLAKLYLSLGTLHASSKEADAAKSCADKALAILTKPENIMTMNAHWLQPKQQIAECLSLKTEALMNTGKYVEATESAREAIKLLREEPNPDPARVASYTLDLITCLYMQGKEAKYVSTEFETLMNGWYKKQLTLASWDIDTAELAHRMGDFKTIRGDHAGAEQIYATCIRYLSKEYGSPDRVPIWYYCADAAQLEALGRGEECIVPLKRALENNIKLQRTVDIPWRQTALRHLFRANKKIKNYAEAEKQLLQLLSLSSGETRDNASNELIELRQLQNQNAGVKGNQSSR